MEKKQTNTETTSQEFLWTECKRPEGKRRKLHALFLLLTMAVRERKYKITSCSPTTEQQRSVISKTHHVLSVVKRCRPTDQ